LGGPLQVDHSERNIVVEHDLPSDEHLPKSAVFIFCAAVILVTLMCCWCSRGHGKLAADGTDGERAPMDPAIRNALCILASCCVLGALFLAALTVALVRMSLDLAHLRTTAPQCEVNEQTAGRFLDMLGLTEVSSDWEHVQTLLRLALREPQLGYGYGYGTSGRSSDSYGYYGRQGDRGYGLDAYGGYGSYGGGLYGGYGGGLYGEDSAAQDAVSSDPKAKASARQHEILNLPTTQGLSCWSPRCDRNASTCAATARRTLSSPYGCCNDYMLIMLRDVTEWLDQQRIPYFVTYGTLLGAVRDGEILPYTQDMDIVVDRASWPLLSRGLEAAEFFGGRRYLFGVDQWDEKVSRVCTDWDGFSASTIGGPDGDRFTRGTEFHLDIYAQDWWQITDLHLIDCIEPLGTSVVHIRGYNFSAPARPRACLEKLYGADWRTPKHGLSGVN